MKLLCCGVITPKDTCIERVVTRPVESYLFVRRGTFEAAMREARTK